MQRRAQLRLLARTSGWPARRAGRSAIRRRSASSGAVKLQPTISCRPCAVSASEARRRSRWRAVSRPEAPWRGGSVAGRSSSAPSRATSSIRSASRVTSARRNGGHGHVEAVGRVGDGELERPEDLRAALARDLDAEQPVDPRVAQADRRRGRPGAADVDRPGTQLARRTARSSAGWPWPGPPSPARAGAASRTGPRPRCAGPASARCGGCWGRSRSRPPSGRGSSRRRPRSARRPSRRRSRSGPRRRRSGPSPRSSVRVWPSRVSICSPACGPPDGQLRARHPVEVEGVQRLPGEQHHVVGDVDDVGDRALPGGHQPGLQPAR